MKACINISTTGSCFKLTHSYHKTMCHQIWSPIHLHDRELYCKVDPAESGRLGHSSVMYDRELTATQKLVLEFQVTVLQLDVALLMMVMAKTLKHLTAAIEGLISVGVQHPQAWNRTSVVHNFKWLLLHLISLPAVWTMHNLGATIKSPFPYASSFFFSPSLGWSLLGYSRSGCACWSWY